MSERYEPPSAFLKALIDDEAPLAGGAPGEANLRRLIALTVDGDPANRDWATLLLAQQDSDTPTVREALLRAAGDENEHVRAEAILGLAQRDRMLALPFLMRALSGEIATWPLFEAATLVAHPALVENLRAFAAPSGDDFLDRLALEALRACEGAAPESGE